MGPPPQRLRRFPSRGRPPAARQSRFRGGNLTEAIRNVGGQLAQQALAGDILMLSSTSCVFCERARRWMLDQQVPFSECFIERDADCAARYQALGARGTPTLLVRGQAQLGFSPQQVLARLQAQAGG